MTVVSTNAKPAKEWRKPTARAIASELVRGRGPFNYRRFVAVENVSWGLSAWEADLLVCSASGYLYEVEIKISIADLKRDRNKRRWRYGDPNQDRSYGLPRIRGMWFAMTPEVWAHKDAISAVPEKCGVIVVDINAEQLWERCHVARACKRLPADKLTTAQQFQLARLVVMRYWSRKEAA
jgi:hypothetical protein